MKYYGKIIDNKDLVTKEYTDAKIASTDSILKGDGAGNAIAATTQNATLIGIDSAPTTNSSNLVTSGGIKTALNLKVDSISGKGLSTNDYTTAEKTKLSGIAEGATAVSESTVSGWGFTKNTGTYSKPSGGIPASDIADGVIPITKDILYITASDVTVATDDTKGVSPYNTSYGYTGITINNYTEDVLEEGLTLIIMCSGTLIVSSTYRNTRIRFGESGSWIPVYLTTGIAAGSSYLTNGSVRELIYTNDIRSDGAFHIHADSNNTYSPVSLGFGYGTCSTAAATAAKTVTLSNYSLQTYGIVAVNFTYDVPASATMNINDKGTKAIWYNGAAITAGIIKGGDIAIFMYDGSRYRLLGINKNITGKANLSGGNTFSGDQSLNDLLYLEGSTPFVMSHTGKVGMRAMDSDNQNLGQINISNAWYDSTHYGCQMNAKNIATGKYNALRVSHNGVQYFDESDAAHSVAMTDSPAFTGNPTAPTQATSDDSTKLATTAFVQDIKAEIAAAITGGAW